jgi:hypothetical protein
LKTKLFQFKQWAQVLCYVIFLKLSKDRNSSSGENSSSLVTLAASMDTMTSFELVLKGHTPFPNATVLFQSIKKTVITFNKVNPI